MIDSENQDRRDHEDMPTVTRKMPNSARLQTRVQSVSNLNAARRARRRSDIVLLCRQHIRNLQSMTPDLGSRHSGCRFLPRNRRTGVGSRRRKEAVRYTRKADQKRLAGSAMQLLVREGA